MGTRRRSAEQPFRLAILKFNLVVAAAGQTYISFRLRKRSRRTMELRHVQYRAKIVFALMLALAAPAASFAQASRIAGAAGSGNLPISGIAPARQTPVE